MLPYETVMSIHNQKMAVERDIWDVHPGSTPRADVLYCSFPSLKDPSHDPGPEMRHNGRNHHLCPLEELRALEGFEMAEDGRRI